MGGNVRSKWPEYDDKTLKTIVKTGEERARYGQTNRRETLTPFRQVRTIRPKNPQTRGVADLIPQLEIQKLYAMVDRDEWHRLREIKELAIEQIKDDADIWMYRRARVGRQEVELIDTSHHVEDAEGIWPNRSKSQVALAEGVASFLARLTEVQRETVALRYWSNLPILETANVRGVTRESVRDAEKKAKKSLFEMMTAR